MLSIKGEGNKDLLIAPELQIAVHRLSFLYGNIKQVILVLVGPFPDRTPFIKVDTVRAAIFDQIQNNSVK
jgi:hypothetical protein